MIRKMELECGSIELIGIVDGIAILKLDDKEIKCASFKIEITNSETIMVELFNVALFCSNEEPEPKKLKFEDLLYEFNRCMYDGNEGSIFYYKNCDFNMYAYTINKITGEQIFIEPKIEEVQALIDSGEYVEWQDLIKDYIKRRKEEEGSNGKDSGEML